MMTQRKLTDGELQSVREAHWYLQCVSAFGENIGDASVVMHGLGLMTTHGTTDGKPYVEPQPEIGEGCRVATEADKCRLDREYYDSAAVTWFLANPGVYFASVTYRVPVDRIPTDEDAVGRLTVMVQDGVSGKWAKASLLAVTNDDTYPFCVLMDGEVDSWMRARFPYPGELD